MNELFELQFQRLPRTVVPIHYNIQLQPCLDKTTFHFEGKESIEIAILDSVQRIVLNSVQLHIKSVVLHREDEEDIEPEITYNDYDEIITLDFKKKLPIGRGALLFDYSGLLNEKPKGFFRSTYTNFEGKTAYAALTHFETSDARRCFPCWDEPSFKATFTIILLVPQGYTGISNMTVKFGVKQGDFRCIEFDPTPPMSTYMLAVVIGEYDYVQLLSSDGVRVRVYTPLGKKDFGRFAVGVTSKVLPYYKEFFDMKYPLPKLDLVAVPEFPAGASECWGLLAFRDSALLLDEVNASDTTKQWCCLLLAHVAATQWFGGMVTPSWWTESWMYEGFAQYAEFLCIQQLYPEFAVSSQFLQDTAWRALDADSLRIAKPLLNHPSDPIESVLDDSSTDNELRSDKAATLMRTLHSYVGDNNFHKGINMFLTKNKFNTASSGDFWKALEFVSHLPVAELMSTWTFQPGYPLIRVFEVHQGETRNITLTQERFFADGKPDTEHRLWLIPITISTSKNPNKVAHSILMESPTLEVQLNNVSRGDWIKVNPGCTGYYRCVYSPFAVRHFSKAIKDARLPPNDRLGLMDDMLACARAGFVDTGNLLRFMEYYSEECNAAVLQGMAACVAKLHDIASYTHLRAEFGAFARRLFADCCGLSAVTQAPISSLKPKDPKPDQEDDEFDRLTIDMSMQTEGEEDLLWQLASGPTADGAREVPAAVVISQLVKYDDEPTIREAKIRFLKHITGRKQLPSELRASCLRAVLRDADSDTYEQILRLCKLAAYPGEAMSLLLGKPNRKDNQSAGGSTETSSAFLHQLPDNEERMRILRALGALRDDALLARALQFGVSDSVHPQEGVIIIGAIANSRRGRDMAWKFFQYKYNVFMQRYQILIELLSII
ncbi:puromycin-sensitive aminopeptidase-like [Ctenocephalides felis]|uniref:puromycin-sensitive aminopeptidase-like n=1 Tax=Ctenocephalides felis TaxID=7515 RepID=UPI000E6E453C|nr:puromycin-sensitive aminopeptidase-like [Ctenocephalides felis]